MADTSRQLEILQHALGLDKYGQPHGNYSHRNFFCAGEDDEPVCRELVALGLIVQHARTGVYPYFNCSVSDSGKAFVREHSLKPPKFTRSQKRYLDFLNADSGMSFGEYLKHGRKVER